MHVYVSVFVLCINNMSMNEIKKKPTIFTKFACFQWTIQVNGYGLGLYMWTYTILIMNYFDVHSCLRSYTRNQNQPKHKEKDIRKGKNSAIIWNKKKTNKKKKNPPLKYTSDNIYLVNVWYFPNFRKTTFAHSISYSFFFTLYI